MPGKRIKRTPEMKIAEIDEKIAKLEAEKDAILRPIKVKELMEKAVEKGLSAEEIATKLEL